MATDRLQIILDVMYKGRGNLKSAQGDLQRLDSAAEKAKRGWSSMLPGITAIGIGLGGVAVAAKGAWSALEGGAALLEVEGRFNRLAESIGTTGDALSGQLNDGIGLLMTQADQMKMATDLMSLGLTNTADQTVRLSSVAGQLGMDLNQLVLTLTNKTTMRFDSLGVRVAGFDERLKALQATGMSVDAAFTEAFLQQAEQQIALVGDRSDTTAGQLDMLENAAKDAWNQFQQDFATSIVGEFDDIEGAALNLATSLAGVAGLLVEIIALGGAVSAGIQDIAALSAGNYVPFIPTGLHNMPAVQRTSMGDVRGQSGMFQPSRIGELLSTGTGVDDYELGQLERARTAGWDPLTGAIVDNTAAVDEGSRAFGGYAAAIDETAMAVERMSQESGDLFSRLRNQKDFNLMEEVFGIGDRMGWSAYDMSQFGVSAGLFDQGRANELLNQSFLLQNAERLIATGMGGSELVSALKALEGQTGEGANLAENFFQGLDSAEAALGLNTDQATAKHDAWVAMVESQPVVKQVVLQTASDDATDEAIEDELFPPEPRGGGA